MSISLETVFEHGVLELLLQLVCADIDVATDRIGRFGHRTTDRDATGIVEHVVVRWGGRIIAIIDGGRAGLQAKITADCWVPEASTVTSPPPLTKPVLAGQVGEADS